MSSAYLLLESAFLTFFVGFGWAHWRLSDLRRRSFWIPACALMCVWFVVDQVAVAIGLWTFPPLGSLSFRLWSLPAEEYLLFVIHTFVCFVIVRQLARELEHR
jgi:lycopene cyclase domain-containing protein